MMIFMVQGASAGIIGALLGSLLGLLLAYNISGLLPIIGISLGGASLPVAVDSTQVLMIALLAMGISLLSTLYPSWRAAAVHPAEALRYE
jgi:lipoprotein-releasing system permease protein